MDRETLLAKNAVHGLESAIELSNAMVHIRKEHAIAILELLKEQKKKVIRVHKKHIVAVSRDAYSLTGVYQQIIEELIDSGELVITRKINGDVLEFIWHLETESEHV